MRRFPEPEKRVRYEVRENLEYRCKDCKWCKGQGTKTIWDCRFDGMPYVDKKDKKGRPARFIRTQSIPCVCPLGDYYRSERQKEATAIRQPELQHIIEGQKHVRNWLLYDPTLPKFDESQTVEPGDFTAMIAKASMTMTSVKQVNREYRKRQLENWLVRFIVNILDGGAMQFEQILQRAREAGRGSADTLRAAGELVRVKITRKDDQELWSLE